MCQVNVVIFYSNETELYCCVLIYVINHIYYKLGSNMFGKYSIELSEDIIKFFP